jgi:hypothetical protein
LGHIEQRQRITDKRVDDRFARAQAGHVGLPPAEDRFDIRVERLRLVGSQRGELGKFGESAHRGCGRTL